MKCLQVSNFKLAMHNCIISMLDTSKQIIGAHNVALLAYIACSLDLDLCRSKPKWSLLSCDKDFQYNLLEVYLSEKKNHEMASSFVPGMHSTIFLTVYDRT